MKELFIRNKSTGNVLELPAGKTIAKLFGDTGYIDGYVVNEGTVRAIFCCVDSMKICEVNFDCLTLINREDKK